MTVSQQMITIAAVILATVISRFLPYLAFPEGKEVPSFIHYLGRFLAPAVFGMLVVYCFKNVSFTSGTFGIPELISTGVVIVLYLWKRNMFLPICGGTFCYIVLLRMFF